MCIRDRPYGLQGCCSVGNGRVIGSLTANCGSVSYTHLDIHRFAASGIGGGVPDKKTLVILSLIHIFPLTFALGELPDRQFYITAQLAGKPLYLHFLRFLGRVGQVLRDADPVSYTHLDVYKRQRRYL